MYAYIQTQFETYIYMYTETYMCILLITGSIKVP